MKNKVISILLFVPLLLLALIFSLTRLYGSVADADKILLNHDVLNAIRIDSYVDVSYQVLPDKFSTDVKIKSSDPSIVEVIEPTSEHSSWQLKGIKEGEVTITAYLDLKTSICEDSVNFYCYTPNTRKMLIYDGTYSPKLISDELKYGQYDFDDYYNKKYAKFDLSLIDISSLGDDELPSKEAEVNYCTSNLEYTYNSFTFNYEITIKDVVDANNESYIEFKSKKGGSDAYIERYYVDVVADGINVYDYQDLMHCTNKSEEGEIVVLKTNLESAQNTFMKYDYNDKDKYFDVESSAKFRNTELFGTVSHKNNKNLYLMDDYIEIESTYDTKYLDHINSVYPDERISTKIKVGINLKKDLYGNGFTINMHELTFPSGVGTITEDGVTNIFPTADDYFKGGIDFVAISYTKTGEESSVYKPVASVMGQDNIGLLINGDNIKIDNCQIKSCNNVSFLSNLAYVGTTVEVMGDNCLIENSIIQNGRVVLRSFSNKNLIVKNSLLRYARDFIIKVGSNQNYYSQYVGDTPNRSENERFDNEITLDHVYTQSSGFFSVGVDAHFNGQKLIDGDETFLSGASGLGATSKGSKITLKNGTKFYDWKNYEELDTSTLIQIKNGVDQAIIDLIFQNFDISKIIGEVLEQEENKHFMNTIEEPVLDKEGNVEYDDNGNIIKKEVKYVHGGIAFYGGGYNYSKITDSDEDVKKDFYLDKMSDVNLTGLISSFAGDQGFNFYMYDKHCQIQPSSAPNIEDLRLYAN